MLCNLTLLYFRISLDLTEYKMKADSFHFFLAYIQDCRSIISRLRTWRNFRILTITLEFILPDMFDLHIRKDGITSESSL